MELKTYNSERIYWAVEQVEQEAGDIDTLHLDDTLFYLKSEADAVIGELNDKLRHYPMMVSLIESDNKEIRRLKRALWLARVNSAEDQFFYWCARLGFESGFTKADIRGYSVNTKRRLRTIGEWIEYWKNVKSKCIKKVEEYK